MLFALLSVKGYISSVTASSGSAAGGILFFMNYMPYFFLVNSYSTLSMNNKVTCCLLHNIAMAFGCQIIGGYEGQGSKTFKYKFFPNVSLFG